MKTNLWKQVPEKRKAERSTRISHESLQEGAFHNILETVINAAQYSGGKRARVQGVSPLQVQNPPKFKPISCYGFLGRFSIWRDYSFDWGHLGLFSTEVDDRAFDVFCSWQRRKSEAEREWAVCRSSDLSDCDRPKPSDSSDR